MASFKIEFWVEFYTSLKDIISFATDSDVVIMMFLNT